MKLPAKYATQRVGTDRFAESDRNDRQERDAYLIGILRALDQRIARVRTTIDELPPPTTMRPVVASREHRELDCRLVELESARKDLVDVIFRCQ
jgi:hypothetical protein